MWCTSTCVAATAVVNDTRKAACWSSLAGPGIHQYGRAGGAAELIPGPPPMADVVATGESCTYEAPEQVGVRSGGAIVQNYIY